jgi:hypothetical protein
LLSSVEVAFNLHALPFLLSVMRAQ